jgi:hypothetical protein
MHNEGHTALTDASKLKNYELLYMVYNYVLLRMFLLNWKKHGKCNYVWCNKDL